MWVFYNEDIHALRVIENPRVLRLTIDASKANVHGFPTVENPDYQDLLMDLCAWCEKNNKFDGINYNEHRDKVEKTKVTNLEGNNQAIMLNIINKLRQRGNVTKQELEQFFNKYDNTQIPKAVHGPEYGIEQKLWDFVKKYPGISIEGFISDLSKYITGYGSLKWYPEDMLDFIIANSQQIKVNFETIREFLQRH